MEAHQEQQTWRSTSRDGRRPAAYSYGSQEIFRMFKIILLLSFASIFLLHRCRCIPAEVQQFPDHQRDVSKVNEQSLKVSSKGRARSAFDNMKLPDFSSGGLVFFVHIPKTGGTTIRRNFQDEERVDYIFAASGTKYNATVSTVEDAVVNGTKNNTIVFYEIHALDSPSFYGMRRRLRRWRDTAAQNSVPVFFFTILRDPLAFAFSHFSFFHVQRRHPSFEQCNATEANLLRLSLRSPQCQFLYKGEPSMRVQNQRMVWIQPDECALVQEQMSDLLDWVGTTEELATETLPLLARIFNLQRSFQFQKYRVSSVIGETFSKDNVSETTIETILDMSALDTMLYEATSQHYSVPSTRTNNVDQDDGESHIE